MSSGEAFRTGSPGRSGSAAGVFPLGKAMGLKLYVPLQDPGREHDALVAGSCGDREYPPVWRPIGSRTGSVGDGVAGGTGSGFTYGEMFVPFTAS